MAFTSDFEVAFITQKHPRVNVSTTFSGANVLLHKRWTLQALTKFWRCAFYWLNQALLTFISYGARICPSDRVWVWWQHLGF
jgi:uncharacterized membrane protein